MNPHPKSTTVFKQIHMNVDDNNPLDKINQRKADLEAQRAALQAEEEAIARDAEAAARQARQAQFDERLKLLQDIDEWRELARNSSNAERAKEYWNRARNAERQVAELSATLGLENQTEEVVESRPRTLLSTNKAIAITVGLFLLSAVLTWLFGKDAASDPNNAMGYSMFQNAPIRALLSFTLTFLTVLVGVFLIRIFFPQLYRIWHNRIESERTFESLINEAPSWAVLGSILLLVWLFSQLFAGFYQALYA